MVSEGLHRRRNSSFYFGEWFYKNKNARITQRHTGPYALKRSGQIMQKFVAERMFHGENVIHLV